MLIKKIAQFFNSEKQTLLFLSFLCFLTSVFRVFASGSIDYFFLNWNLFLAFLPWYFSLNIDAKRHPASNFSIATLWLLFLPNAPYIITDFIHLQYTDSFYKLFDAFLISLFSVVGLMYYFLSISKMRDHYSKNLSGSTINILIIILQFIIGFGIYLGRYLRWNSWDLITSPIALFSEIFERFADPMSHPRTWLVTISFGIFLNVIYWFNKYIKEYLPKQDYKNIKLW